VTALHSYHQGAPMRCAVLQRKQDSAAPRRPMTQINPYNPHDRQSQRESFIFPFVAVEGDGNAAKRNKQVTLSRRPLRAVASSPWQRWHTNATKKHAAIHQRA
ncbi:MAG: hypothetical protein K8T91_00640, partial [Planctomycetes bacterium]|nr:hypothetical protein [Planctomycetota bacterium]